MRIQKFKGELKGTTKTIDNLQIYEENGKIFLIEDLYWIDGHDYSAFETYDLDEFDRLIEYFKEIEVPEEINRGPDWIIKAQTAK